MKKLLLITLTFLSIQAFSQTDTSSTIVNQCSRCLTINTDYLGTRIMTGIATSGTGLNEIGITKVVDKLGEFSYHIYLMADSSMISNPSSGITIFFNDGSEKGSFSEKVIAQAGKHHLKYTAHMKISDKLFEDIAFKGVASFKISNRTIVLSESQKKELVEISKCLMLL